MVPGATTSRATHRAERRLPTGVALAAVAAGIVLVVGHVLLDGGAGTTSSASAPPATASRPPVATGSGPREVLRAWDAARAAAWAAGDPERLAALYTAGSVAGRRDVRLLERWSARSLHVTRLEPQVLALVVEDASATRLVLRVTDRLATLRAEVDGEPVRLPRDGPSTRRVVLERAGGTAWRVASVGETGGEH